MKSVDLNFLEPSGPLQACNGTDVPFTWNANSCLTVANFIYDISVSELGLELKPEYCLEPGLSPVITIMILWYKSWKKTLCFKMEPFMSSPRRLFCSVSILFLLFHALLFLIWQNFFPLFSSSFRYHYLAFGIFHFIISPIFKPCSAL
jgi:hypothetical protein